MNRAHSPSAPHTARPPSSPRSVSRSGVFVIAVPHDSQCVPGPGIAQRGKTQDTPAQALRMFRVRLGWTIGRAAVEYGVRADTWSAWERGRQRVDAGALMMLQREVGR